ncbi:DUF871 domain-containing protein [Peribacillus sp. SCS-26]|uniref:DUF871 domain-containing protein n=1 Tax=Paraperibacillus marinus TaxID=3115295 RepID=UPI003906A439
MLGVSVYLGHMDQEAQGKYLERMKTAGFSSIFTSLHIPEDDSGEFPALLKMLGSQAGGLGMELMADISPISLEYLGIENGEMERIKELGVTGLRMDYGIEEQTIAALSNTMKVALNASTIDEAFYNRLNDLGMCFENAEAWHNYYPRPETGLDKEAFIEKNKWLESLGFTVMAFVPGDENLRGPIFKGLPTLEDHRGRSPFASFLDLHHVCHVSKVLIGDRSLTPGTMNKFKKYSAGILELDAEFLPGVTPAERDIAGIAHKSRPDPSRDVIRSEPSRIYAAANAAVIKPGRQQDRKAGAITIDNEQYGRYQGELQIIKEPLDADPNVNVIGHIRGQDIELIPYLYPGKTFTFKDMTIFNNEPQ